MTPSDVPGGPPRRREHVGLEAVAREAGVSLATASRALNGGAVGTALRQRVETAAQALGYRPDLARQAVARGVTRTVALIVDYLRSPFGVEITRGVVDAAARHDLVVNVTGAETNPGDLLEMIAAARAMRPQALILATGRVQDASIREPLIAALTSYQASGGTVAIVDGIDLPFASCSFDETTAALALCRELVRMGYRRPLVFNSSSERADLKARTHALEEGFVLAGLDANVVRLEELSTSISRRVLDEELLDLRDADVVVCVEGEVIPAVYRHIRQKGLRVGSDVAVTAFGQYGIVNALRPHLTTVELPLRRAGELALEHALTDSTGTHLSLPANLRIRASSPRRADTAERGPVARRRRAERIRSVAIVTSALNAAELGNIASQIFDHAGRTDRDCLLISERSLLATDVRPPARAVDALIVCGPLTPALADYVSREGVVCVVIDAPSDLSMPQLTVEVAEGMQRLLEHLVAHGHTWIHYVEGPAEDAVEQQRRLGIDLFASTHESVRIDTSGDLSELPHDGATAVVSHSDLHAAQFIRRLVSDGIRVPDDLSVAGFGGTSTSALSSPGITTVLLDTSAIAGAAWRLLDADSHEEVRSLRSLLVERESTGPARTR